MGAFLLFQRGVKLRLETIFTAPHNGAPSHTREGINTYTMQLAMCWCWLDLSTTSDHHREPSRERFDFGSLKILWYDFMAQRQQIS